MDLLTIYVLNYESPEKLDQLLDSLLPFHSTDTQVIVGDNSPSDCARAVVDRKQVIFRNRLKLVKHVCNLGPLANILRAYEVAESKYVWIVGRDDRFLPGALGTLSAILEKSSDAFVMFPVNAIGGEPWPPPRTYSDFVTAFRALRFGPLTNISSVVYRVDVARDFLPVAYEACSSLVPHTAILAAALQSTKGHRLAFHATQLFERSAREQRSWDPRKLWNSIATIFPDPSDESIWRAVRKELLKTHGRWMINRCLKKERWPVTSGFMCRTFGQFGPRSIGLLFRMLLVLIRQRIWPPRKPAAKNG